MTHVNSAPSDEETELLHRLKATPRIFDLIRQCSAAELAGQKKLREHFDTALVRAALSVHEARLKAVDKLPHWDQLWLTRVGLEQSTAWEVARHKANRFHSVGQAYDLCCGIGVDSANIAAVCDLIAVDVSPSMCVRTAWNSEIWGISERIETQCRDVLQVDWSKKVVHLDPDRRADSDRPAKRLEHYHPNLAWMQMLVQKAAGGAMKVGPASNFLQKFPDCEIELISLHGECREATVWFGSLAGEFPFRATTLPTGESISAEPLSAWTKTTPEMGTYLFDPDPAIVRSGLLDVLAERNQLLRLDAEEEYLTSDQLPQTGFVTAFEVEAVLPNSIKELKKYLKPRASQYYEVKCRRIPVEASTVRRQLPAGDEPPRVILFARVSGRVAIVVARRLAASHASSP